MNLNRVMNKSALIYLIQIIVFLWVMPVIYPEADLSAQEQVPVEVSRQKIVYDGMVYYMHQVKKGQTLYSISKAYNVTVSQIINENKITDNSIKEGQILRIPATGNPQAGKKDTVVVVRKEPGQEQTDRSPVSTDYQRPVVTTPARQDERYIYHRVKRGETLGSIAAEYGITVKDLKKANKRLLFPHEGDYLLIPRRKISSQYEQRQQVQITDTVPAVVEEPDTTVTAEEAEVFTIPSERTVIKELNGSVRVAVMLPFYLKENSVRSYIDSTRRDSRGKKIYKEVTMPGEWIYEGSLPFLETYEGILIAADSLRLLGLSVELDVYDTEADSTRIDRLIWSGILDDIDLIIGPAFSYNFNHLAAYAAQHDIPVVSPVQLRDQNILENRPTLYRVYPTASVSQDIMISEIKSHPGSNVVFLYSDTLMNDPGTAEFWQKLVDEVGGDGISDTTLISSYYFTGLVSKRDAYSGVESIDTLLKPDRENLIVLADTQTPVVSAAFSTLHSLTKKYDIKVFGYPELKGLETIDLKYYYDLELVIPSESYIDFNKPASVSFSTAFMKRFKTEPMAESFAWRGFDVAWYFIGGIASYGKDFLRDPGIFNPELLCLEPDFRRESRNNGYENRGMFILHYKKDMTIDVRRSRTEDRIIINDQVED
jgi:LysM repeat protein/ABC-type branched-subunit amino acid transport system substrate-binding protein